MIANLVIIPPGVDLTHFYPIPADEAKAFVGLKPDDRMVLFVGRIEPLKGVETLIRAMSSLKLQERKRPVHLAVIGGDPAASAREMTAEMRRLQRLCDDLHVEQTVIFLGKRRQDTLQYYYSAAEVAVMPSHYESFGMVALEAMACGTPVIASEVGGLGFLVQDGDTGFTIPDDEPDLLCERLSSLLGSAGAARANGRSRRRAMPRTTPGTRSPRKIVDVYEELVAVRAHSRVPAVNPGRARRDARRRRPGQPCSRRIRSHVLGEVRVH